MEKHPNLGDYGKGITTSEANRAYNREGRGDKREEPRPGATCRQVEPNTPIPAPGHAKRQAAIHIPPGYCGVVVFFSLKDKNKDQSTYVK